MSRDASGTFTNVAGIPVTTATVISSTVFNNEMADLATEMTDSLSRSGKGGMTAAMKQIDGSAAAPAYSFTNETSSGLYRNAASDLRIAVAGVNKASFIAAGTSILAGISTTPGASAALGGVTADWEIQKGAGNGLLELGVYSATAAEAGMLGLARSKSATPGTQSLVALNDTLGTIGFWGSDGTAMREAVRIAAFVDAATGANDVGGRFILYTAPDGTITPIERLRIMQTGSMVVTPDAAVYATPPNSSGGAVAGFTVQAATPTLSADSYSASVNAAELAFRKSRNATVGSQTIVTNGDALGSINFYGTNGTAFDLAARIRGSSDAVPGAATDMPGRLEFWTTPDASATALERWRISQDGTLRSLTAGAGGALEWLSTNTVSAFMSSATLWEVRDKTNTKTLLSGSVSATTAAVNLYYNNTAVFRTNDGSSATLSYAEVWDSAAFQPVGYKNIPQNIQAVNYTLVLADAGKQIFHASGAGAGDVYTIPANASVAYPIGTVLTFVNADPTNTVSIAITTDTMTLIGTATTGSRTLGVMGVATALKMTATTWVISGSVI